MAWYGVNFVLGAGLHSYGFGGGGQGWVYTAIVLQLLYAGAACYRGPCAATPRQPPHVIGFRVHSHEPVGVGDET
jgi:hypothetical protein